MGTVWLLPDEPTVLVLTIRKFDGTVGDGHPLALLGDSNVAISIAWVASAKAALIPIRRMILTSAGHSNTYSVLSGRRILAITSAFQAESMSFMALLGIAKSFISFQDILHDATWCCTELHTVTDKIPTKMPKLTETYARKLTPAKSGTVKHWDTEVKGLVLFVGKRSKTWYFQKDVGGKTQRMLIGRYPLISAETARTTAMGYALEWSRGAGKQLQIGAPTLAEATEVYLARPKLRSEAHKDGVRAMFENHLGDWMGLPLDEISKAMVARRHQDLARSPSAANHTFRYFRTVWNHARRVYELPESPTQAIEWFEEQPNGQIIEDLAAWRRRIDDLRNPIHTVFYELLLFTGLRKTEALTLEWKNVHEDHIHLPMTKNGRSFDLPILQVHHEILAPVKGLHRQWVFPSPKTLTNRLSSPERMDWSPHAHRRTFATVAMEAGVLEEIVGRLLNHTPLSITGQRYVKPSLDALRPAMEKVASELICRTKG